MKQSELRAEQRVSITHRGNLGTSSTWIPCLIQDVSGRGFQVMCTKQFRVGEVLDLISEFYPGHFLKCKVEVRHFRDMYLGAKIVEISDAGLRLCRQFMDEHVSLKAFG